jgi:two-component system KDP operon response regulator KdpE
MRSRVLVVAEDSQTATPVTNVLAKDYAVQIARDTDSAIANLRGFHALIVTDIDAGAAGRIELCRRARLTSDIPILVWSRDADAASEVAALDAGADDYITARCAGDTLAARVRAALRRVGTSQPSGVSVGDFHIDFHDRRVRLRGTAVRFTPKEFELFLYMARHPNRVVEHRTLLRAVWGQPFEHHVEYLRVFVGQLRKKIEADPANPRYFVTEPWIGYRFNATGSMAEDAADSVDSVGLSPPACQITQ